MEEWKYSSVFLTSALDGGSGQLHAPAALLQGKEGVGPHGRSGRCYKDKNIPASSGNQTPVVQLVV